MTIKNFDALKQQLKELHPIVNAFKSEAVQLRIVELILDAPAEQAEADLAEGDDRPRRKRTRRQSAKPGKSNSKPAAKKTTTGGRKGPATLLNELIDEGFFKQKRMLKDMVEHAGSQKARKFKQSDLSGTLARFVRDKKLNRKKNPDGQYEYYK